MNPTYPLDVGRALARHVGLKPDLQSINFFSAAPANEQSGLNPTNRSTSTTFDYRNVGWLFASEQVALYGKRVAVAGLGGLCALTLARLCQSGEIMGGDNGQF